MAEENIKKTGSLPAPVFSNILFDIGFANIYAALNSGVFLTGYLLYLGANNVQIGLITSLPLLANITAPVFSFFIDKSKERKKRCLSALLPIRMLWFVLAAIPVLFFYGYIKSPLAVFSIIFFFMMILGVAANSAWLPWMGDLIPAAERGYYFGKRIIVGGLAALAFSIIGGQYIDLWKGSQQHIGFSTLFGFSAIAGIISYIFISRVPDAPNKTCISEHFTLTSVPKRMAHIAENKNFMNLVWFNSALSFATAMLTTYINVYMIKELKLSYGLITLFAMVNLAMNLVLTDFWAKIIDKYGCRPVMMITIRFIGLIPIFWFFTALSKWLILVLYFFGGAIWSGFALAQFNIMLKLTPSNERASYIGMNTMVVSIVSFIAPLIGGFLLDSMKDFKVDIVFMSIGSFQVMFILSALLRQLPVHFLKKIEEPKEYKEEEVIRVVRSSIGMGFMDGVSTIFSYMILPLKEFEHYMEHLIDNTIVVREDDEDDDSDKEVL